VVIDIKMSEIKNNSPSSPSPSSPSPSHFKFGTLIFSLLIVLSATALFIVGGCGYTTSSNVKLIAWLHLTSTGISILQTNLTNVDVYAGLRVFSYSYNLPNGETGSGSTSIPNGTCTDASTATFALLVIIYFLMPLIFILTTMRMSSDDCIEYRTIAALLSLLAAILAVSAFASWYEKCFVEGYNIIYNCFF
jgi:hypothetical protein